MWNISTRTAAFCVQPNTHPSPPEGRELDYLFSIRGNRGPSYRAAMRHPVYADGTANADT